MNSPLKQCYSCVLTNFIYDFFIYIFYLSIHLFVHIFKISKDDTWKIKTKSPSKIDHSFMKYVAKYIHRSIKPTMSAYINCEMIGIPNWMHPGSYVRSFSYILASRITRIHGSKVLMSWLCIASRCTEALYLTLHLKIKAGTELSPSGLSHLPRIIISSLTSVHNEFE